LLTWRKFQSQINELTEPQLQTLLDEERSLYKRVSMLVRIHQRLSMVRTNRERLEILKDGVNP
jgi:hypothetical protein